MWDESFGHAIYVPKRFFMETVYHLLSTMTKNYRSSYFVIYSI